MSPTQKLGWLFIVALLAGCTFQTEALDGPLGTSCGHYALSHLTTESRAACWVELDTGGECFMSAQGACGARATRWPPGTELTQWCPIGNPGTEVSVVVPCD
jgi:hypothetical protein